MTLTDRSKSVPNQGVPKGRFAFVRQADTAHTMVLRRGVEKFPFLDFAPGGPADNMPESALVRHFHPDLSRLRELPQRFFRHHHKARFGPDFQRLPARHLGLRPRARNRRAWIRLESSKTIQQHSAERKAAPDQRFRPTSLESRDR